MMRGMYDDYDRYVLHGGKPKMETSKKILLVLFAIFTVLIVFGGVYAWVMGNDSVIVVLAGGVVSFTTVAVGFYYWKARAENLIKLKSLYGDEEGESISDLCDEASDERSQGI